MNLAEAILIGLAGAGQRSSVKRIVTPQTMQAILVALERSGFVAGSPHHEHGRVQITELTASGRGVLEAASGIVADSRDHYEVSQNVESRCSGSNSDMKRQRAVHPVVDRSQYLRLRGNRRRGA